VALSRLDEVFYSFDKFTRRAGHNSILLIKKKKIIPGLPHNFLVKAILGNKPIFPSQIYIEYGDKIAVSSG